MLEGDTVIKFSPQLISFDRFIAEYPENSAHRYELHSGVSIEKPKLRDKHSEIAGFLSFELGLECRSRQYPFIGNPKQPTISVYQLIDEEYQIQQFRGNESIESSAFPELNLTAEQIFQRYRS